MKTSFPPKPGFFLRITGLCLLAACAARGAIDVTITTNPTAGGTFAAGVWTPSASPSRINVNDLITALNAGNVTINTTGALAEAGNITVATTVPLDNLTTAVARTLTLNAQGSVFVSGAFSQTVGGGNDVPNVVHLAFNANLGGSGTGVVTMAASVDSAGGNIAVNGAGMSVGAAVAVVTGGGTFTTSVSGAFSLGGSPLTTSGGAVSLNGGTGTIGSSVVSSGGNISVSAGTGLTFTSVLNATGGAGVGGVTVALNGVGALTLSAGSEIRGGPSGDANVTTFNGKLTVAGLINSGAVRVESLNGIQDLEIQNTGSITATLGRANLRAGNQLTISGPVSANTDLLIAADTNGGGVGDATCAAALTARAPGIFVSGVNTLHTAGVINANNGALQFTASGTASMSGGSVTGALGGLLYSGTSVSKTAGTIDTTGGNARFSAPSGTVTVGGGSVVTGGGTLIVEAVTYSLSAQFTTSGGSFTASATGAATNTLSSEVLSSGGDISVSALNALTFTGKLNASGGAGSGVVTVALTGAGTLTLPAASEIRGGPSCDVNVTTFNGKLTVAGLINSGTVRVESLNGVQDLEIQNTGSITATLGRANLRGGNHVTVSGPVSANTDLLIAADTNGGGVGDATCAAALTARAPGIFVSGSNTLHTAGVINANNGALQFTAVTAASMSGGSVTGALGDLLFSGTTVSKTAGTIDTAGGDVRFRSLTGTVTVGGGSVVTGGGTLIVEAVTYSLSAQFTTSGGSFTASATGAATNTLSSEVLSSGGDISVSALNALTFTGKLNASGGAGSGVVTVALTGAGTLTLPAASEIRGGPSAAANVTTFNGKLTVAGLISCGSVRVESLNGVQDLEIQSTASITATLGRVNLRGGNYVTVSGPVTANTDLLIAADTNNGGVGDATCAAALTAHAPGIFVSGVDTLHTVGVITTNGGSLQYAARQNANLTGGSAATGGGNVVLSAATFSVNTSFTTSGGTFTATGATFGELNGSILSNGGNISATVTGAAATLNIGGNLNTTGGAGAGTLNLRSNAGPVNVASATALRSGGSGDVIISGNTGVVLDGDIPAAGDVDVDCVTGNIAIGALASIVNSGGFIAFDAANSTITTAAGAVITPGAGSLLHFQARGSANNLTSTMPLTSGSGGIELLSDNNLATNATLNTTGPILLQADADLNLAGTLTVASPVTATTGNITLRGQGVAVNKVVAATTGTIRIQPNAGSTATITSSLLGTTLLVSGTTRFTTGTVTASALTVGAAAILDFDTAARLVSPGAFSQQNPTGETRLRIGGTAAGQLNRIAASGAFSAGGKLTVSLEAGFVPALGQTFDLFDFTSFSGSFATLNLPPLATGLAWDPSQLSVTGTLRILKPIEAWRQKYFGSTADSGPGASLNDFDFDGIANLVEYALGLDPKVASTAGLPVLAKTNVGGFNYLTLTITRPLAVTDLDYRIRIGNTVPPSSDGSLYSPAGDVPSNGFTTQVSRTVVGENEVIVVRDNVLFGILPQRFMQLKVTHLP